MRRIPLFMITWATVSLVIPFGGCDRSPAPPPADTDKIDAIPDAPLSTAVLVLPTPAQVKPGEEMRATIKLSLAPDWHTYGDPPGDSGMPPTIGFSMPEGWQAELEPLPPPQRFEDEAGVTLGYETELSIRFRIMAPASATVGQTVEFAVNVQWLICKEICLPRSALLTGLVRVVE